MVKKERNVLPTETGPSHVVHADTVNSFKSRLDNFWKVKMYYMIIMLKFMEPEAEVKLVQNFYYKIYLVCI